MNDEIVVYFDGACEPVNPGGTGAYGYVVTRGGETLAEGSDRIGSGPGMTNNVAEYRALIAGLSEVRDRQIDGRLPERVQLVCRGDSRLVCEQVAGHWRCNAPHLAELRDLVRGLARQIAGPTPGWRMEWIPRAQNERADALSRLAYAEARA
jgi:ribonuclease HI